MMMLALCLLAEGVVTTSHHLCVLATGQEVVDIHHHVFQEFQILWFRTSTRKWTYSIPDFDVILTSLGVFRSVLVVEGRGINIHPVIEVILQSRTILK
ncbi:uncharacterized protein LOC130385705 isoform X3 [Gadus chalcogrammus]|uniref:uncharacterized protein LOC130385705 isoform X3 n=1 Tax=Gadus chalcogrammus TaxID=1042646 RepID=UPI0024C30EEF|nr:uncharacterized protein LOC130385705 isoform X3 [Gadus chalcogrammus]